MPGMEDIKDELFVKAEIHNSISHMLECLLDKGQSSCKSCQCVDACSLLSEVVNMCRARKIRKLKATTNLIRSTGIEDAEIQVTKK